MYIRSLGAFGNLLKERFGIVKIILLNFSAIVISTFAYIIILRIIERTYKINIGILH